MTDTAQPHCVVLDWGTTNFRAVLVDAKGAILDRVETPDGIQSVPASGFEASLAERIAPWRKTHGPLPVYASGMIGSRNGWIEVPYVHAPAGIEDFAKAVRRAALRDASSILFIAACGASIRSRDRDRASKASSPARSWRGASGSTRARCDARAAP